MSTHPVLQFSIEYQSHVTKKYFSEIVDFHHLCKTYLKNYTQKVALGSV